MKKYISLIVITFLSLFVVSCTLEQSNEINDKQFSEYVVKTAKKDLESNKNQTSEYDTFLKKVQCFSYELSTELYEDNEKEQNFVVSPISIYMALAMTAEAASDNSRDEILNALGVTYEEMNEYTKYLYSASNRKFSGQGYFDNTVIQGYEDLNNSIWVDENVALNEMALESLANNYYVSTYKVPFLSKPKEAADVLRKYIKEVTHGLIDKEYQFSNETIFTILNTYYLKDIWDESGHELKFTKEFYEFINYDNSVENIKLLTGYYLDCKPYVTEKYSFASTKTNNGFYLKFIVPNDGYSIDDVYTKDFLEEVNNLNNYLAVDDERREYNHTRCLFPEFDAEYDNDIKETLSEEFGIKDIFDIKTANLSNLVSGSAYIDQISHQTKLIVNSYGIEGAAVTSITSCGAAGPGPYVDVYHDFVVDKSFAFMITNYKGTVLFSGVVKNV